MEFAGGREFIFPSGSVFSANITPDQTTGIGNWTKEQFINRFKIFTTPDFPLKLTQGQQQTIMPWKLYAGMNETDLGAIYSYLQTLKPIKNKEGHFGLSK